MPRRHVMAGAGGRDISHVERPRDGKAAQAAAITPEYLRDRGSATCSLRVGVLHDADMDIDLTGSIERVRDQAGLLGTEEKPSRQLFTYAIRNGE